MSNPAPSSHSRGEPQPVNPYAASREAEPHSARLEPSMPGGRADRHFQARMDWGDRRNFLNSVGPTRIAAVCGALLWLKSTYELVRLWYVYLSVDPLEGWPNIVMFGLALVALLQGLVALYGCWLDWKYAERLREVAGGETACMANWSLLHLRTAWLYAAVGVLGLVSEIGQWIVDQALAQRLFPV